MIEPIVIDGVQVALIVRSNFQPEKTQFLTADQDVLQLGYIVYGAGKSITPHIHKPAERSIRGTPEVLYVRKGRMRATFYSHEKIRKGEVVLDQGDVILLFEGGHGFDMLEDTVLMEIKQGPYMGELDKERFINDSSK